MKDLGSMAAGLPPGPIGAPMGAPPDEQILADPAMMSDPSMMMGPPPAAGIPGLPSTDPNALTELIMAAFQQAAEQDVQLVRQQQAASLGDAMQSPIVQAFLAQAGAPPAGLEPELDPLRAQGGSAVPLGLPLEDELPAGPGLPY